MDALEGSHLRRASVKLSNGNTYLHLACQSGNVELVSELSINNKEINNANEDGFTPLINVIFSNKSQPNSSKANKKKTYNMIKELLENGANPNLGECQGYSVLHWAIKKVIRCCLSKKCVKLLIEYGADRTLKNKERMDAYQLAKKCNCPKMIDFTSVSVHFYPYFSNLSV